MKKSEYVDYLLELLAPIGGVSARAMFGGYGLYKDGLMFALVADEILYLKTDDLSRTKFEAEGLAPFTYEGKGRPVKMSYYRAPEEALDSAAIMTDWARLGFAAALRAAAKKSVSRQKQNPRQTGR